MKKISKLVVSFLLMSVLVFNFSFAEPSEGESLAANNEPVVSNVDTTSGEQSSTKNNNVPFEVESTNVNTQKVEQGIKDVADKTESFAYTIVEQISDKSLPICAILILWGAVLYFILGIRNLYKKRQGLLLMWGAFTFVVMAKIINFAFWFAFVR